MAKAKYFPPVSYLKECFSYNPETGAFVWLRRPPEHFASRQAWAAWNTRFAGIPAFTMQAKGYLLGRVSFEGAYFRMLAHRVAWALMTNAHTEKEIDHKDRNRANNAWENLREATDVQNAWNSRDRERDLPRGVTRNGNGFSASMHNDRVRVHLGTFKTPEEASRVWRTATIATRGDFAEAQK